MDINTLLEIVETRMQANEDNPTAKSFLHEIYKALQELKELKES